MKQIILRGLEGLDFIPSKIIEWDTRSKISHIETQLSPGCYLGALLSGGVQIRRDKDYGHNFRQHFFSIDVTDEQNVAYWKFLGAQVGKPYDWRAISSWILGDRDWDMPDAWFCSELVAAACKAANIPLFNWSVGVARYTPRDVVISPIVKVV